MHSQAGITLPTAHPRLLHVARARFKPTQFEKWEEKELKKQK